ncbi:MFS transporter [Carboxydothermus hydrogenoformans]|uniref:Major facilitator superfamily protein n=1 Tax=Carboxydothermus hydrogenoformans (strain ATCC BAA-161 / DSM 6008 / Z-2901) TaxID=246194 RepID=Q3A9V9_CARHZ|nr:MFS transporter [Carboxydothermus hydrogenoformans]ABB14099.1 major facilitator superfamily protein [Carboxydothermus hydrogenoformans Z-2901]
MKEQSLIKSFITAGKSAKKFLISQLFVNFGYGVYQVLFNLYLKQLGLGMDVAGQVVAASSLAQALFMIPAGYIGDRYGRRRFIFWGSFVAGIMLIFQGIFEKPGLIILAAFLFGLGFSVLVVNGVPYLSEVSLPGEEVKLIGLHYSSIMIASMLGNFAGGMLSDLLSGMLSLKASYRASLISGALIFLAGNLFLTHLEKGRKLEIKDDFWATIKGISADTEEFSVFRTIFIFSLLIGTGSGLFMPYLNLYFANRFGVSNTFIGLILAGAQGLTSLAMVMGTKVSRRFGLVRAFVFFNLISLPFAVYLGYVPYLSWAVLVLLTRHALMNAGTPLFQALNVLIVDPSRKGLILSLNQATFSLGWAIGGPISTIFYRLGGYPLIFWVVAILYCLGTLWYYYEFRKYSYLGKAS